MQTFLPYPDFARSARVLDPRRLGKQRVETLQILRALRVPGHGWRNHPAVRMWRGHAEALTAYGLTICTEWCARGYADTCADKIVIELTAMTRRKRVRSQAELRSLGRLPPWLGRRTLHASHRSALVRKEPEWYRPRLGANVPDDLPYVWPIPLAMQSRAPRRIAARGKSPPSVPVVSARRRSKTPQRTLRKPSRRDHST